MRRYCLLLFACTQLLPICAALKLTQVPKQAELLDMQEFVWQGKCSARNPFTDVMLRGEFIHENGKRYTADGFCDAPDGSVFRLRFLPCEQGRYTYTLTWQEGKQQHRIQGELSVASGSRKGIVRVDPNYPTHFKWDNSDEHFFWNGTTAYWIMGWKEENVSLEAIDRLARLGVNRIRVAISGRQDDGKRWSEPWVKECDEFTFMLNPWVARQPRSLDHPEFDVTRFNIPYWQRLDRMVRYAQERDVVLSLIFYVDGLEHGCDPFKKEKMGGPEEQLYYRYAAARYSASNNIMWDVANEYHLFRTEAWVEKMGRFLHEVDPYKHLISVHGNEKFPFRKEEWVNMVLYQTWDECGGYDFMYAKREEQLKTGRPLPSINEEYGYEDHYAPWGCGPEAGKAPGGRNADNRSKLAWEMYMAGGYQTTGERANDGTGAPPNTGGGWINGRGNDNMTMLRYYRIIRAIFESIEYWKLEPRRDLVNSGNMCLAEEGAQYLVYARLQHCRIALPRDQYYSVTMIDPQSGQRTPLGTIDSNKGNGAYQYPALLHNDVVFILQRTNPQ